jgi:hypothetical protein
MTEENADVNSAKLINDVADGTTAKLLTRVGMLALIGLSGWQLHTTQQLQIDVGVMKSQISDGAGDRYHGVDAARDLALRDSRIGQNTESVKNLWTAQNALAAQVDNLKGQVQQMQGSRTRGMPFP